MSIIIPQELMSIMEASLLTDPTILQAKVIDLAAFDAPNQDLVVALSIHPDVQQSDAEALRTARRSLVRKLREVGGKAVVPKKWVRRTELPVTVDGEVDEAALKQSLVRDVAISTTPEVPVESVEEKVMRIVSQTIAVPQDQLILTRSFAQNGGDSFTAIRVFQGLMRENISLRVPDIMGCETLAELPALVISRSAPATPTAVPNGQQAPEVHQIRLPAVESRRVSVTTITV